MTASVPKGRSLRHIGPGGTAPLPALASCEVFDETTGGLAVPLLADLEQKNLAMDRIASRLFVGDADTPQFAAAQDWIEACGRQVRLPLNFCGGLLIMRLYRLISPASEQAPNWMEAVYKAVAAYDFAFLALGHADDEADMTRVRDGQPTRFVTHPDTRSVDGINLLLSGVTAMQETLASWPHPASRRGDTSAGRHPFEPNIMEKLVQALKEASFPIILDRSGLGHVSKDATGSSGLAPIRIDAESLGRVEAFTRHRAHTYFIRAAELAALLAGYDAIDAKLADSLDKLFGLWGSLGAATDDLQDIFIDFAAGIHSVCTVMAHLCVAEDPALRPQFRRNLPEDLLRAQRMRLAEFFGVGDDGMDCAALLALLDEIELRRALTEHFEAQGTQFADAVYNAAFHFGFDPRLMMEIVSVVSRDPEFRVPEIYLSALQTLSDENILRVINVQVGKFITSYFVERFWPKCKMA